MNRNVCVSGMLFIAFCAIFGGMMEGLRAAEIKLDNRGLVEIPGVLRADSTATWGANNLILKPNGGWAAQDYCLADIKSEGNNVTALYKTNPKMNMTEKAVITKNSGGETEMTVSYLLTPVDEGKVSFERIFFTFPIASADFAGGSILVDGKTKLQIPEEKSDKELELPASAKSLTISKGNLSLTLKAEGMRFSFKDLRPKATAFQICLDSQDLVDLSEIKLEFTISANTTAKK